MSCAQVVPMGLREVTWCQPSLAPVAIGQRVHPLYQERRTEGEKRSRHGNQTRANSQVASIGDHIERFCNPRAGARVSATSARLSLNRDPRRQQFLTFSRRSRTRQQGAKRLTSKKVLCFASSVSSRHLRIGEDKVAGAAAPEMSRRPSWQAALEGASPHARRAFSCAALSVKRSPGPSSRASTPATPRARASPSPRRPAGSVKCLSRPETPA